MTPWYDLFEKAHCPRRHMEAGNSGKLSGKEWLSTLERIKSMMERKDFMCSIVGPRGPGKTQMGVELIRDACKRGIECSYHKVAEVFMRIKEGYRKDMSEEETLRPFVRISLLVLDEIQERSESDWENRLLTYLIDKRYDSMKPTILIGNLTNTSIIECLGDSIYSRMVETGGIIECKWESFRR